ncbi:hypothetical protein RhiirA1_482513 [Rhizophagus irregularis]|uniref:CCHC-type domain-containing protein n=1 Tax=Rhizophagus irregularis TaxID=588596 RepID=A0A2N0QLR0_9GLOM|nr:hypothetical protein RhiirA1_482513 [Rhizophagus irregularis]
MSTALSFQNNFTLQSLHHFQGVIKDNKITRQNNSKRNRFGVAFSTAKTAINVALNTKTDGELIKILKDFIAAKHEKQSEGNDANNILDYTADQLLGQDVTNPNVTKIHEVPSKKRLKNAIELSKKKVLMQENLNEPNNQIRSQRKCLLCGKSGHYQKKCPNAKKNN